MITFRLLQIEDLAFLNEVRNHCAPEYLHDSRIFTLDQTIDWFNKTSPKYYIILNDGMRVGYFRLSNFSTQNNNLYVGADIHPSYWRRGLAYKAYTKFLQYLFTEYKLNKITLEVLETNHRAIGLYKKLGFEYEGTKRQEVLKGDTYVDSIIMSILKQNYNGNILENK